MTSARAAIGVFDSGVGGLSVWRELVRILPGESTIYLADQAHVPYGPRPAAEVRQFAEGITRWLLAQGAKAIVVACNAASAAALQHLRQTFPLTPFIGMEPAVKPAAQQTQSGVVGVLATPGTFQGQLFAQTAARFAAGVRLINQPCPGLVESIERGEHDGPRVAQMLRGWLEQMLAQNADSLVLACTHYPFVLPVIRQIVGDRMRVIDPAPAVARQLQRVLRQPGLRPVARVTHRFCTTGPPAGFRIALKRTIEIEADPEALAWQTDAPVLRAAATP